MKGSPFDDIFDYLKNREEYKKYKEKNTDSEKESDPFKSIYKTMKMFDENDIYCNMNFKRVNKKYKNSNLHRIIFIIIAIIVIMLIIAYLYGQI